MPAAEFRATTAARAEVALSASAVRHKYLIAETDSPMSNVHRPSPGKQPCGTASAWQRFVCEMTAEVDGEAVLPVAGWQTVWLDAPCAATCRHVHHIRPPPSNISYQLHVGGAMTTNQPHACCRQPRLHTSSSFNNCIIYITYTAAEPKIEVCI